MSSRKNPMGVRAIDTMTAPYTDIPIKRDSFNETIFTLRVSKARKSPTSKIHPLYTNNTISHVNESSDVQTPIITGRSPSYTDNNYYKLLNTDSNMHTTVFQGMYMVTTNFSSLKFSLFSS